MRVVHIIPSAFEYFDDIRSSAFALIAAEGKEGIESEALTIQYGTVTAKERRGVQTTAPKHSFQSLSSSSQAFLKLAEFDIVHIHCPTLGVARQLIAWKKSHPTIPFVITWHRSPRWSDLFSLFIMGYTAWYMRRLFPLASAVVALSSCPYQSFIAKPSPQSFIDLTNSSGQVQLDDAGELYSTLYSTLIY